MLRPLLGHLAVARLGPGRPRTRPDALLGDKAYSSRGTRALLRAKRVKAVIPQPADQIAHRQRRGSAGGRPPAFDAETYKGRNVVERSFNDHKQWRGLATRYDKLAAVYRGGIVAVHVPEDRGGVVRHRVSPRARSRGWARASAPPP
jgi:transposase